MALTSSLKLFKGPGLLWVKGIWNVTWGRVSVAGFKDRGDHRQRDVGSFLMLRLFLPDSWREIGPQSYSHKELRSATKTCTWKRPQTSDVIFVTTDTLKFSLVSSEKRIKPRLPWTSNLLLIYDLLLWANKWCCFKMFLFTAACQASLSFIISWILLKFMSTESVMPSNHIILYYPLLPVPSVFPSMSQLFTSGGQSTRASVSNLVAIDYAQQKTNVMLILSMGKLKHYKE